MEQHMALENTKTSDFLIMLILDAELTGYVFGGVTGAQARCGGKSTAHAPARALQLHESGILPRWDAQHINKHALMVVAILI